MPARTRLAALAASLARSTAVPAGAALGLLAAGLWLAWAAVLDHDVGWLLVGARRLLAGAPLYLEGFVDVNPPGILYWMAPAVRAAQLTGISETRTFPVYLWLCAAALLWLCDRLLRAHFGSEGELARRWAVVLLAFVFAIAPAAGSGPLPVHALGQREHVLVLLLTPLVLLAALRLRGGDVPAPLAAATGALAGVALCAKPQYLVCVAALELARRARRRALRPLWTPELAALAAVGVLYLGSIAWLTPAYFTHALPLALDTYWAYQAPAVSLVAPLDLAVLAAAGLARVAARRHPDVSALCDALGVATASAYVAYLLGGTSWPYHALPFRSYALASVGCVPLLAPAGARAVALRRWAALTAGVAAAALAAGAMPLLPWGIGRSFRSDGWKAFSVGLWQEQLARHAPGGPLWVLATALPPAFPLVNYAGVEWSSRFSCQWVLPALLRSRAGSAGARALTPERADAIERWLRDAVVADLEATPPGLVLVDVRASKPALAGAPLDFLAWYARDGRFRRIWSGYRRVDSLAGFDVYRRDPPAPPPR